MILAAPRPKNENKHKTLKRNPLVPSHCLSQYFTAIFTSTRTVRVSGTCRVGSSRKEQRQAAPPTDACG